MELAQQIQLRDLYRDSLLNDVLPFWTQHGVDREHGGFLTCLDRDGTIVDTDKSVWAQGRTAWLFGELYNTVEQRPEWLELAKHGIDFIDQHCFDPHDGRMWFHLTRDGQPIRKRRYAFSESFAAIAYGELAKATGNPKYAEQAQSCFDRFISHNLEPTSEPKFTDARPMRSLGFPMITINTAQELRDSIGMQSADGWTERSIETIREFHIRPDLECVLENVGMDGELIDHFDGRTLNPGHAIEGAWFILSEAAHRGDDDLKQLGCQMLDWMWKRGWDEQYGGILYFVDSRGLPVQEYWHDMKFWWPQNEASIATAMAAEMTSYKKYWDWFSQIHEWSFQHFPDSEYGEWFGYLHRDGRLSVPLKGNLWKGPFHIPRMLLQCWRILDRSISSHLECQDKPNGTHFEQQ